MEYKGFINKQIAAFMCERENSVAFSLYDGRQVSNISYQEFARDICAAAGYFSERGIRRNHIAIAAPNSYDWIVTFFAIIASGNIAVPLNQDLPEDILHWECEKADITTICCDGSFAGTYANRFPDVKFVLFDDLKKEPSDADNPLYSTAPDETIFMLFTSGTTGKSKAVEITSDNWRYGIQNFEEQYTMNGMECVFTPLPLYHIVGLLHVVKTLHFNKTVCIGRGLKYTFLDMPALNPTVLNAVPAIVETLVKMMERVSTNRERQKYTGCNLQKISFAGAAMKQSAIRFLQSHGYDVTVIYGMTEISAAATWGRIEDEDHISTVGKFCSCTQHRFQDGELLLKGPTLMKGYYNDPKETEKIIENGWIHTGDLGYCDEDGYLYLTGRKKNVIILSNGENVNPEEIEDKFAQCPQILECLIFTDGRGICADIYTEDSTAASEFIKNYNQDVPMYRQVYKVNYSATPLEKTGSGKIKRKENVYV